MKKSTLTSLMLLLGVMAQADEIGLKTTRPIGQSIKIALNVGVSAELTWSNGETERMTFDGTPQLITVKSDSLTLESSQPITRIYLPGNELIRLNTRGAGHSLKRLLCASNQLSVLDLTANTQLEELDCQDNELTTLTIVHCTKLTSLNCSRNKLTRLEYSSAPKFESLLCAENLLDTLRYQNRMTQLSTLWCQGNRLNTLTLTQSKELRSLSASSNGLYEIQLSDVPYLNHVWLEHNQLSRLDLSTASGLTLLSVHHNNLYEILWTTSCRNSFTHFYAQHNQLMYNSLPTIYSSSTDKYTVHATLMPQRPYPIEERVLMNERQDFSSFLLRNGWGISVSANPEVSTREGEVLVRNEAYSVSSQKYTFHTPKQGVTISTNSNRYPGCTFSTTSFEVYDGATPIEDLENKHLTISADDNSVTVETKQATRLRIYTLSSVCIVDQIIGSGRSQWRLPSGIYLVNGKKIIIS